MIAATNPLTARTVINNKYEIINVIGQGGFGRTYLARETKSGEQWVLKEFVPANINNKKKAEELFIREADTLEQLAHPQIPKFKESFEENGRLFLVQEFVNGDNYWKLLSERKQQGKVFSEDEVTQLLQDLLPVLSYIHGRNLIHRDISPDNIILPHDGSKPKLIDFGIVGQVVTTLQTKPSGQSSQEISLTRAGKQGYAAPEQILTGKCYPSSDLYALAVTMLVLLTGKQPDELFDSSQLEWKWRSYVTVSPRLGLVLDHLLKNVPNERWYTSADAVLASLQVTKISSPPAAGSCSGSVISLPVTPWKQIFLFSSLGLLLMGVSTSFVYGMSPNIPGLCQVLDNCTPDPQQQEWAKSSDAAIQQANSVNQLVSNAQNIEQLQNSRNRMAGAIKSLESIPPEAEVYSQVQQSLPGYRNQLQAIETRLGEENNAKNQLDRAANKSQEIAVKVEQVQTLEDLQTNRNELANEITSLQNIKSQSFVYAEAQQVLPEYNRQLQEIDRRLTQEKQAKQDLEAADQIASQANSLYQQGKANQDIAVLENAQQTLNGAFSQVRSIPVDSLFYSQGLASTNEYNGLREKIDREIQMLKDAADSAKPSSAKPSSPEPSSPDANSNLIPCDILLYGPCKEE